ncbi:FHA domain-containing protein, partial [bacterium]|nr:FHA domain-containing protein [bacterium]
MNDGSSKNLVLLFENGTKVAEYSTTKNDFTVGRSSSCDISIELKGMSRIHLQVQYKNELFYLKDLNTTYGTKINGVQVSKEDEILLNKNDKIKVGSDVAEIFIVRSSEAKVFDDDVTSPIRDIAGEEEADDKTMRISFDQDGPKRNEYLEAEDGNAALKLEQTESIWEDEEKEEKSLPNLKEHFAEADLDDSLPLEIRNKLKKNDDILQRIEDRKVPVKGVVNINS